MQATYLDCELVVLHGGINEEQQWLRYDFVPLVSHQPVVILGPQRNSVLVYLFTRLVESNQAFFGVDFPLELEHFLSVIEVSSHQLVLFIPREGHCKASLYVDFSPIDVAEKCTNHSLLFFGSSHIVIKNVRDNGRVNAASK